MVSPVWLIPMASAVAAAVVAVWAARAVAAEMAALEASRLRLAPVSDQIRTLRDQLARTAEATESTLDSLGATPHR